MIETRLKQGAWDGLYNDDLGCACELANLAPCSDIQRDCTAGYKHVLTDEDVRTGRFDHILEACEAGGGEGAGLWVMTRERVE